ncbi:MAG: prolyl aminopeptidase [Candidatus Woesearchaeota archaeon]
MGLYPKIRPYKKGYLKVTDGHRIYCEICGNPKGISVLYLHGGPGGGISPKDRRYFNPKIFKIILFDQRGSGKSKPFASIQNNTTQKLVQDIRKILKFLKIKKVFLFGGSWGSTLALVYAIKYPKSVLGILLRGIFLCRPKDDKHYLYNKKGKSKQLERLTSIIPKKQRKDILSYYNKQMHSKNKKIRDKFTYEWAYYEISIIALKITDKKIKKLLKKVSYKSLSPLEVHYLKNKCFLKPNYILKNIKKINKIPISIVHGKNDLICPKEAATTLHKKLKNSRLYLVHAGHSASEKEIQKKLVSEMNRFAKIL